MAPYARLAIWPILATAIGLAGCASLTGQSQFVKIATDIDRATVTDGDEPVGEAPGFFEFKRASSRRLTLSSGDESRKLDLVGRYRWSTSFLANALAGLIITPYGSLAGMAIDLLTGAAWEYDRPKRVNFFEGEVQKPLLPKSITVAPPLYGNEVTSNELADELYLAIKQRYPKSRVYSYSDQLGVFSNYEANHESPVESQFRDDLYRELKTTHIAISRAERDASKLVLKVKIIDLFRDQAVDSFQASIQTEDLIAPPDSLWTKTRGVLMKLIPNSIGVQSAAGLLILFGPSYRIERTSSMGMLSSSYSLSFSNLLGRKVRPKFGFRARLVPSITLNGEEFRARYASSSGDSEQNWSLFQFGVGIGPEVGLYTALGYLYLNYIPELTQYWIQGPQNYQASAVTSIAELGYSAFMSDRFHFRLFVAIRSYPPSVFDSMVTYGVPSQNAEKDVYGSAIGFSVGYIIPEGRKQMNNLLGATR